MADSGTHELLFAHDNGGQFLSESPKSGDASSEVERVDIHKPKSLASITDGANDLEKQRWAVVITDDDAGDRLRALVQPLVERRAEEQEADVLTVRVPPGMDAQAAMDWKKDVYPELYDGKESKRPAYLMILGDMDQVSLATQQVLQIDGFPGRLVCPSEEGYQAYVDKVLRWEKKPSRATAARSVFFTVHDGTAATDSGYESLVKPCLAECEKEWREERKEFPASAIVEKGDLDDPDPDEFLDLAKEQDPTVLFSMSHGLGPPRGDPWTPKQARQRQGAMYFGTEGSILPADIEDTAFLPGGFWFYFACFGAGTPSASAYYHWMEHLAKQGLEGVGNLKSLLQGLDSQGGFTSGLAQAALANPNGPLGVIGHVDLAWSYSFEELRVDSDKHVSATARTRKYVTLLSSLIKRDRLGAAKYSLELALNGISTELNGRYDKCKARGVDPEGADEVEKLALGQLWMQRQDLRGYMVLGDPAVRLPLSKQEKRRRRGIIGARNSSSRSSGGSGLSDRHEKAILRYLLEETSSADLSDALGVGSSDAKKRAEAYRKAGRAAVEDLDE